MPEERRLVTVLFADVVGSTAIGSEHDPEVVRSVMSRYFARMKEIAETHGGTVEKFIGDAVMVVFGVPRLHDDDAERAVRTAFAMRAAVEQLNDDLAVRIETRMGVNTGEAVTTADEASSQFLVTGDPVNVAARLQQGAEPGEIVVGSLTERLTRLAIEYEPRVPMAAKGKAAPLETFRAMRARSAVPDQARGLPAFRAQLVGRQRELRLLLDTFDRVRTERRAHLFTLVGAPGVGKSRLTGEVLARISGQGDARILRGRCLPYGSGITWFPMSEILREDAGIAFGDPREAGLARLDKRVAEVIASETERRTLRARLAVLLGLETPADALPGTAADGVPREIAWALRRYVEALAERAPLVLVVDDLQWAEDALFGAVEQIADRVTEVPLLVLCIARPELLELRAGWGGGKANATLITLDALSPAETRTLIGRLLDVDDLPEALRQRIVERSEGNPLFCEEFLRMLIDDGRVVRDGERWRATGDIAQVRVPETVQAVLGARLDRLGPGERRALQVASVIGEKFALGQVAALGVDDAAGVLDRLLRKGLVSEDREAGEPDAYRFKHLLVRDVAYASLAKAERADLHERFARELETALAARRDEVLPLVAHHAERAFTLAAELRQPKNVVAPRAARALELALAQGEIALSRGDVRAVGVAGAVARRAVDAIDGSTRQRLEVEALELTYVSATEPYHVTRDRARALADRALAAGEPRIAGRAMIEGITADLFGGDDPELFATAERTAQLFDSIGDVGGAIHARLLGLEQHFATGALRRMLEEGAELLQRALATGEERRALAIAARLASAALWWGDLAGAERYLDRADELGEKLGVTGIVVWKLQMMARVLYVRGHFDEAVARYRANRALYEEAGHAGYVVGALRSLCDLYLNEERWEDLDALLTPTLDAAERVGDRWNRAELLAYVAERAAARGDLARARDSLEQARRFVRAIDVTGTAAVDRAASVVAEASGRLEEAEALLRKIVTSLAATDYVPHLGPTRLDLAEFLARHGRVEEAAREFAEADATLTRIGYHWRMPQRERLRAKVGAVA